MKLLIGLFILLCSVAQAETTVCYNNGQFFTLEIPTGWASDTEEVRFKQCAVLYPLGHTFKTSPVILTVGITKEKSTLDKFISNDLKSFSKKIRIESEPDLTNVNNLTFSLRKIHNSPRVPFIARAYLNDPVGLKIHLDVKKNSDIPLYEGVYKEFLANINLIKKDKIFEVLKTNAETDSQTPTGKDFNVRYLNAVGKRFSNALKSCKAQGSPTFSVIRVSESGEIMDWFDQTENKFNACVGKRMLHAKGTKAPFAPFHIFIDLEYHLKNFTGQPNPRGR